MTGDEIFAEIVRDIDDFPTLSEIAGGELPESLEGKALLPVLQGKSIGPRTLYWEHQGNRPILDGDWKLVATAGQAWELYNLSNERDHASSP